MEQFVKSLYDRLEGKPNNQSKLIGIMDGAINEMHNSGIFARLPEDLQARVHSSDPEERITVKAAIAKDVAVQRFILSSKPAALKNGDIAHIITVKYDPDFINSIALCIQGGLEGLYLSGAYKRCADEIMYYYIQPVDTGNDLGKFRLKMLEVESLYDNFQINFMPPISSSPADSSVDSGSTVAGQAESLGKKGLFGKLFGKK